VFNKMDVVEAADEVRRRLRPRYERAAFVSAASGQVEDLLAELERVETAHAS
jgi:50S ribosomal subunit-associated GTPase HflX